MMSDANKILERKTEESRLKAKIEQLESRVRELESLAFDLRETIYDLGSYGRCDCEHPACRRCHATKEADVVLNRAKQLLKKKGSK